MWKFDDVFKIAIIWSFWQILKDMPVCYFGDFIICPTLKLKAAILDLIAIFTKYYKKCWLFNFQQLSNFLNNFCSFGPLCSVEFCRHVCGTLPDKKSINLALAQLTKVEIFGRSGFPLFWLTSLKLLDTLWEIQSTEHVQFSDWIS